VKEEKRIPAAILVLIAIGLIAFFLRGLFI
jgi:hypothetical protein